MDWLTNPVSSPRRLELASRAAQVRCWLTLRKLLWLVLVVVALGSLSAGWLVGTSSGRDVVARQIESFTTSRIPGSMKIGALESVGLFEAAASDVEFFDPNGQRVMHVRDAMVEFALDEIFRGTLGFEQARADGGEVIIDVREDGRVTIEDAFKQPESEDASRSPDGEVKLELHNMHFEGMTLLLRLSGETRFIVDDVRGFMSVWRRDTRGVRVALAGVEGVFREPQIFGNTIELENMEGEVWAQEDHVVSMKIKTKIGSGAIDATLDYHQRPERKAHLKLDPEAGSGARLITIGTNVRSWFSDTLEVTVE